MAAVDPRWASISRLVLGSKSWSRRTLLQQLCVPEFEIQVPSIDERAIRHRDPRIMVLNIAIAKARHLIPLIHPADSGKTILITGDSVVTHKHHVLGKPADVAEAHALLTSYSTAPSTTIASIAVVDVAKRLVWSGVDEAEVYFHSMPPNVVHNLANEAGALESAGALRIEHPDVQPYIECVIGHKSALMGFSLPLAERLLSKALLSEGGDSI